MYCGWLTEQSTSGGVEFPDGMGMACLPTEAEWEWACSAGAETEYWNGDGEEALREVGWYGGNSGSETHAVGQKPRTRGVCTTCMEMSLNGVTRRGEFGYRGVADGDGDAAGKRRASEYAGGVEAMLKSDRIRVLRGGSWGYRAGWCRSACRNGWGPNSREWFYGFRVCLVPGPYGNSEGGAPRGEAQGWIGTAAKPEALGQVRLPKSEEND